MRRVLYSVAMSLDGYIAGPNGEFDWIPMDPSIDWAGFMARFDTVLVGRKTYSVAGSGGPGMPGVRTFVFSRTLKPPQKKNVTLVSGNAAAVVADLRSQSGKDIWLMGGGVLFRSLLEAGQVDAIEIGVVPILLGEGLPFLPAGKGRKALTLTGSKPLPSGMVMLSYEVK